MHCLEAGFGKLVVVGLLGTWKCPVLKFCDMYRVMDGPAGKGDCSYSLAGRTWRTWIVSLLLLLGSRS